MPLNPIGEHDAVGAARDEPVVVIPVFGAIDDFARCLESILRHTAVDVRIVVADDATPGDAVRAAIEALASEHAVFHMRGERNAGFVANVNGAFRATDPADVALVNSDCVVGAGWLEGLRDAARSDTRVATASALADRGSIISLPGRAGVEVAAPALRAASPRLRPRIPTAIGHCFYVRRAALELVGDFDEAFAPAYGEEVDFSQRCILSGLVHVVADDVYVQHRGEASFGARAGELRQAHERLIERRYPHYAAAVRDAAGSDRGPLRDALAAARRSLDGMSVTIEASALGPTTMGTQVTTLALIRALAKVPEIGLRIVVPRGTRIDVGDVEVLHPDELERGVARTDIVHRPSQVTAPKQLDWLNRLGERIVITHQDLIAYANPGYFDRYEDWDEHRTLTRQALALADAGVFVSDYVRREAYAEELITRERAHVVPQGVDSAPAPAAAEAVVDGPFVLCLGADFRHKNRLFALRVFEAMRDRGYDGSLVLAGPHMPYGSTRTDEQRHLADRPELREKVITLEEVSDSERARLYSDAALVLYPTLAEGFGLIPFEAAHAGTPCMFAAQASLVEVAGAEHATIVPWDPGATADRAMALLADDDGLARRLAERGDAYTWQRTAGALLDIYGAALARPAQPARAAYFGEAISDVALSLVGPGGYLPPDVQRALLAISTRAGLRRPVFASLRASYRALRALRRRAVSADEP